MARRTKKTSIFLVIDSEDLRSQLTGDLQAVGYVVNDYMTAREFLIDKRHHSEGVVVADYRLRDINGVELCEQLSKEASEFPVVLMAGHADTSKVLASGMAELVVRPIKMKTLIAAITHAQEGVELNDAELVRAFRKLTEREREVIDLVVDGQTSREIAAQLDVSIKTVESHRSRIMAKTRASDVWDLAVMWRTCIERDILQ